jgi:hypothetical protein
MHNEVAEFVIYADIKTTNDHLQQFVNYKSIFTFVYIDFELRRESDNLWWFHAPSLYEKTACGGIKLVSIPEGTLMRAIDFADSICKIAFEFYVRDMEIWFHRFGLLRPKPREPRPTSLESKAVKTSTEDIMRRIDELHLDLGGKLDDIKRGQVFIYQRIGAEAQTVISLVLKDFQQQSIGQGEIQSTLDAIRRALKHIQSTGLPIADDEVKKSLDDIYQSLNSNLDLRQQLELSLPVIPFLLEYKISLDADVDLGAVWRELAGRVQKNQGQM